MANWTVDANEALALSLGMCHFRVPISLTSISLLPHTVRSREDKASLTSREAYEGFHPTFTYPVCLRLFRTFFLSPENSHLLRTVDC